MKVEKISKNTYRVRKYHKGKTRTVYFDHKPSEREVLSAVADVLEDEVVKGSFENYANDYIKNRNMVLSPASVRTYRTKLNQISKQFKSKNLYDINNEDVQKEVNQLSVNLEPKTVKTTYGFITSILGAYRPKLYLKVTLPQIIRKQDYDPTNEDIRRILDHVKGTRYSVPFQLGVLSCRRGEICALDISDLDGNDLYIHRSMVYNENNEWVLKQTPKTDESNRILPLPPSLVDEIRKQGFIYEGHPGALNKAIHRAQKKLGIPQFKFHKLRSYFASYAHSLGIPEADILKLGGWKTPNVMKSVYRKSLEVSNRESIRKISEGLF